MDKVSEELMLRDKSTGRWIKRSDEDFTLSKNLVPSTFITVNNNVINYTDTNKIIQKIDQERKTSRTAFLEDKFNKIVDSLDNYRAYNVGIEKVFDACEEHSSEFDNRIRAIVEDFDYSFSRGNSNGTLINVSSAYLKILFSYIYSSFIIHKDKVKNETVIYSKLESFKSYLQRVLENILIPKKYRDELDYSNSMYSNMIYGSMTINHISKLVKFDSRFSTELDLIKHHTKTLSDNDYYSRPELSGSYRCYSEDDERFKYIVELHALLSDIDSLILIREEIHSINDDTIFVEYEDNLNNG
ncbi:hypothetical protein [Shewanella xiamenensis]|uniref:hypothetical protein n=1 Tax=Shewanella xiamenensis TaxID=332186 RepID=UPI000DB22B2C|nr:hypothetical protein [Shewanella xiamenensis]MCT8862053.1 hypothetical protein [Shewanella xiamenensis]MCT8875487.1 hypothetical protein [Shewanella xiamenensis]PZP38325.1 MAG: hypothetical protein DI594_00985 [Shewanella oneidensis]